MGFIPPYLYLERFLDNDLRLYLASKILYFKQNQLYFIAGFVLNRRVLNEKYNKLLGFIPDNLVS